MVEYYQVWLSAETKAQSKKILDALTRLKLILGGTILNGPSHFWWKGKEIDMNYCYIMGFTIGKNRRRVEKEFERISEEEVPMISFIKMAGNKKFLKFIYENTK
ncbi:MAG TPA: divalent cation tolerance protein CutA [Candidatus Nanoarchaeia archaeon]|nr:divalent cation tolerance protein CutA [Candidatus Nanoarchaeia archaeon]